MSKEVIVIGSGLAGMSCATYLAKENYILENIWSSCRQNEVGQKLMYENLLAVGGVK